MAAPTRTMLTPPALASLPKERAQLEFSSRSIVFARDGRRLLRAWGAPDRPFVLSIEPYGSRWSVEAWGVGPAQARQAARELFSLDDQLEQFYGLVKQEPVLKGTERRFRGLRLPRDANVYESLLHAIVGQQLSVASANAIKRRLIGRYGRRLSAAGAEVPVVPTPRALLEAGPVGLASVGLSRAKAGALAHLARWAARAPSATRLRNLPLELARERLEQLPGVGRWTAENALVRGAGRPDVFIAGDLGVRVALDRFGAIPRSEPEVRARAWAERHYPGWGSYATLYLWRRLVTESTRGAG